MKLKIILALLVGILPCVLAAQQINHSITGHVKDVQGRAIPAAMLTLTSNKDSTVVLSGLTSEDGSYKMVTTNKGSYSVKADAAGFVAEMKAIEITAPEHVLDFTLKENKQLSEVTVSSHKPLVEYKADRTVFNIENSISAAGSDAWEALKKTPGVLIQRNQVSIAGGNSAGVMINGRLQQLSGDDLAQLLHSIPSENLSKIEVITTPPAKYDAQGSGGLINIVTKRSLKNGLKGNATLSYQRNTYDSPTFNTTVNYKRDKLSVFSTASLGTNARMSTAQTTTYFPGQRWEQSVDQSQFNRYARLQVGADYKLSKKTQIGIQVSEGVNKIDNTENISSASFSDGTAPDSVNHTRGETHERYPAKHTINVNYEWIIDTTGKKLNVDADYYNQVTDKKRDYDLSNQTDSQATGFSSNRMTANPAITIRSVKADMEWPTKIVRFSFGAKASVVNNNADNNYYTKAGTTYVADLTKTNSFNYREEIQSLYTTVQRKVGKFDLQIGLRGEHVATKGYSSTTGQTNMNDYTKIFPSGYVQYAPNSDHNFSFSATRRINRPRYNSLNPFRFYYTPLSYSEGNPGLQPELNTRIDLSYVYQSKYSVRLFTNTVTNYWDNFTEIDSTAGTTNATWKNMGDSKLYGINTSATLNPAKWWECVLSLNGSYSYFKPYENATTTYETFNASTRCNNSFYLNKQKTFSAELSGFYNTPRQNDFRRWDERSGINLGIRVMLMDKNLILTLNGDDLMARTYWRSINKTNGTREYEYEDERSVRFAATFKFGNKTLKSQRDRNTPEEIQRAIQ